MKKFVFGLVILLFVGCACPNYKTYVNSMDQDLEALTTTYQKYVLGDERLSPADKKARMSILTEMQDKTEVAKEDVE